MNVPDAQASAPPTLGRFEIPIAALGAAAAFSALFVLPVLGALGVAGGRRARWSASRIAGAS